MSQTDLAAKLERYKKNNYKLLVAVAVLFAVVFVVFLCYLQSSQYSKLTTRMKDRISHSVSHVISEKQNQKKRLLQEAFAYAKDSQALLNSAIVFASSQPHLQNVRFYDQNGGLLFDLESNTEVDILAPQLRPQTPGGVKSGFVKDARGKGVFAVAIRSNNDKAYIVADYSPRLLLEPVKKLLGQHAYCFRQDQKEDAYSYEGYVLQSPPDAFFLQIFDKSAQYDLCGNKQYVAQSAGSAKSYMRYFFTPGDTYNPAGLSLMVYNDVQNFNKESKKIYLTLFLLVVAILVLVVSLFMVQLTTYKKDLLRIFQQTRSQLDRQKKRYESFFHQIAAPACIIGSGGRITLVNERMCNVLGYDENEMLHKALSDFAPPGWQWMYEDVFAGAAAQEWAEQLLHLQTKSGRIVEALFSISADKFENSGGFLVTLVDLTKAKANERALEQSRTYLEAVFQAQPEILVITDNRHIERANQAFLDFTGYNTLKDFNKDHDCICELFVNGEGYLYPSATDEGWLNTVLRAPDKGHKVMMERRGKRYVFAIRAKAFMSNNIQKVVVLLSDITEDENLKLRYQFALEGSSDGLWDADMVHGKVYFSPRWKQMLGYDEYEIGDDADEWWNRIHPDDVDEVKSILDTAMKHAEPMLENIHRLKHKSGSYIWVFIRGKIVYDKSGKAVRIVGTQSDITDLKLQQNEIELLQNALDKSPIGIVITDESGRIQYHNSWLEKLTGYEAWELNRQPIEDFISENNDPQKVQDVSNTTASGGVWKGVFEMRRKDGSTYEEYNTIAAIFEGDTITHYIGIKQQLEGETKLKYQLEQKEKMMLAQSRNAAMGEMIGMIAHQWRQPISTISMGVNNILADIELDRLSEKVLKEQLDDILLQTSYLSQTIDDFKDFFKPEKEPIYTTLDDCVDQTLQIVQKSIVNNAIELQTDLNAPERIRTYDREVLQVLLNIIKNAKEAILHREVTQGQIIIKTQSSSKKVTVSVCDNAGGIEKRHFYRIFEPYFTTKSEQNGTGLGLYMSKMITDEHLKGTLDAHNTEKGCCFVLQLPKDCTQGESHV